MDRDAKLAAARRKLKEFKRKKGQRNNLEKQVAGVYTEKEKEHHHQAQEKENYGKDIEIKKSEEFIDEKFELLQCLEDDDTLSESTAATTESILQVSAKLNGIAEEAVMFIDGESSHGSGSDDFIQVETDIRNTDYNDTVKLLETRNQELAAKVSLLLREKETLQSVCSQREDDLRVITMQLEEHRTNVYEETGEEILREQLKVQMQTIGVLVAEKQDLQHELASVKAGHESSVQQHNKFRDDMLAAKERLVALERESKSKDDELIMQEKLSLGLQNEAEVLKQNLARMKESLDREKFHSAELAEKLQKRESEFQQLFAMHEDLQEKIGMADVLLQQLTAKNETDDVTQASKLQQEKGALITKIGEYQQAFEQLSVEREHLGQQFLDAQTHWQADMQNLQVQVQILETKNQELRECLNAPKQNNEVKKNEMNQENDKGCALESDNEAFLNEITGLKLKLEEAEKTRILLQEEIASQQTNNQHLSQLVQKKEARIFDLENQLEIIKGSINDHREMLDVARNDKVTISRALSQNKQLKQQLEEIEEGFIRMSNDKMDLATRVSSLEHTNNELLLELDHRQTTFDKLSQESQHQSNLIEQLQELNTNLQSSIQNSQSHLVNGDSDMIQAMQEKLENKEQTVMNLSFENAELRKQLESSEKHSSSIVMEVCDEQKMLNESVLPNDNIVSVDNPVSTGEEKQIQEKIEDGHNLAHNEEEMIEPNSKQIDEASVAMLQEKFTAVMRENAELLNRLELIEHANTQLQNECDTIGEYIALYHSQRQVLKQRHREKDEYISTIIQEREAMQGKVEQLQTLVVAMLNNRQEMDFQNITSSPSVGDVSVDIDPAWTGGESPSLSAGSPPREVQLGQPDLLPRTENPAIDNSSDSNSPTPIPGQSKKVLLSSDTSTPDKQQQSTATQILSILEQMQRPTEIGIENRNSMPSGFCMRYIGPYTAI